MSSAEMKNLKEGKFNKINVDISPGLVTIAEGLQDKTHRKQ